MIHLILTSKPTYRGYSIEAGYHDGIKHFDHHGKYENEHCPANNKYIVPIMEDDAIIEITHIDTDSLFGVYRLLGLTLPNINLSEIELIDTHGSSVIHPLNRTLLYMKGISGYAHENKLFAVENEKDITLYLSMFTKHNEEFFIIKGALLAIAEEEYYREALYKQCGEVAIYIIGNEKNIDTARPYDDGVYTTILYNKDRGSISIFRKPELTTKFNEKEWGGILFMGHPGACGSPRGKQYTLDDAVKVFNDVCKYTNSHKEKVIMI